MSSPKLEEVNDKQSTSPSTEDPDTNSTTQQNNNDEQGTTSSSLKAEVCIKITLKPDENRLNQQNSLQSLDELNEILKQNHQKSIEIEDDDSFITIESTHREIATTTTEQLNETVFSRDQRTQNMIINRNPNSNNINPTPPPPPYYDDWQYYNNNTNRRMEPQLFQVVTTTAADATRAPPYRPSSDNNFTNIIFQEQNIRHKFITKVYAILAVQLIFTFSFIALTIFYEPVKLFLINTPGLMLGFSITFICLYLVLICITNARRKYPLNMLLLMLLTLCMAYTTAYLTCWVNTMSVLYAIGITAVICILITIVASQDWFDITSCGMFLTIATIIVVIFGTISIFVTIFTHSNIMYLIYAGISCLLFSIYLLYDTQMILGGRRIELSPEEYILGALTLYVDVIMIFVDILTLMR